MLALGIPSVEIGGQAHRSALHFYTSYEKLLINAFEQAEALGHRRITAPMPHKKVLVYEELAKALEAHFSPGPVSFTRRYNFPLIQGRSVKDYHTFLLDLFRYTPPTCLILHDLADYLVVSSFCLKEGLRIPDDICIILLSYDPALVNIDPSIAHFVLFSEAEALRAFQALKEQMSGFKIRLNEELAPLWTPGNSLAPPRKRS